MAKGKGFINLGINLGMAALSVLAVGGISAVGHKVKDNLNQEEEPLYDDSDDDFEEEETE